MNKRDKFLSILCILLLFVNIFQYFYLSKIKTSINSKKNEISENKKLTLKEKENVTFYKNACLTNTKNDFERIELFYKGYIENLDKFSDFQKNKNYKEAYKSISELNMIAGNLYHLESFDISYFSSYEIYKRQLKGISTDQKNKDLEDLKIIKKKVTNIFEKRKQKTSLVIKHIESLKKYDEIIKTAFEDNY
jgi:hypothetical protein